MWYSERSATNKTKDGSLRSYAKRTILNKFAQQSIYRLSTDTFKESINSRPSAARKLLADDFSIYDPTLNENNVADKLTELFVEIIRKEAGLVKKSALEQQKQHQVAVDIALYIQVNTLVNTYFIRIREIMTNLDNLGDVEYEEIQDQMKAIYRKLKKAKKSNMEIVNTIEIRSIVLVYKK